MRTNVVIDDALMSKAMEASGAKTKKGAIEAALQMMVRMHRQTRIKRLRGKVDFYPDYLAEVRSRFGEG